MDKLRSLTVAAAVAFALAACAQNETTPDDTTASTSGSTTASSESSSSDPAASSSTTAQSDPAASSSTTASTTPDSGTSSTASTTADPGTGSMQTDTGAPPAAAGASTGTVAIGLQVESEAGEPLGTVVDIVADPATGAPLFAVISTEGETTAMPFAAARSMLQTDVLVIERTRLASAPRVEQSDLHEPAAEWTSAANDYWGQGEVRTASPDPGASSEPSTSEQQPEPETEPRG